MREEMTREEAIRQFREMWSWIAEESQKRYRKIHKVEYLKYIGVEQHSILSDCYLCEYDFENGEADLRVCKLCPIDFLNDDKAKMKCCCCQVGSPYELWQECDDTDWKRASMYAKMISELPERPLG